MCQVFHGFFRCGHEGWVEVDYDRSATDREERAKYLFSLDCKECYKKKRSEAIKVENERTAKLAKERGYPELEGSEKQVAWATTIRNDFIGRYKSFLENEKYRVEKLKKDLGEEDLKKADEYLELIPTVFNHLIKNKTKSTFWIDIRYETNDPEDILAKHKEEALK